MACSIGRLNNQQIKPRANMFLLRKTVLLSKPKPSRLLCVSVDSGAGISCMVSEIFNSSNGFSVLKPAFSKPDLSKVSASKMITPPFFMNLAFTFKAAGFITTNTSGSSPGV